MASDTSLQVLNEDVVYKRCASKQNLGKEHDLEELICPFAFFFVISSAASIWLFAAFRYIRVADRSVAFPPDGRTVHWE